MDRLSRRRASTRIATARSRTSCAVSPSCSPTATSSNVGGRAPRQAVGPDLVAALRRLRGHPRRHHRGDARHAPRSRRTKRAPPTASRPSTTDSTPVGGSCSATPGPRCCASTTRAESKRNFDVDAVRAHRPRRRRRATRRRHHGHRRRGVRRRDEHSTVDSSRRWLEHRNDVERARAPVGARASSSTRSRSRVRGRCSRRCTATVIDALRRIAGRERRLGAPVARLPRRRVPLLHLRGRPDDDPTRFYRRAWDVRHATEVLRSGGALSHHHGVGRNRARFVPDALGQRLRAPRAI